jgi:dTDP-4-amino-4,6-dideoxygalactose transaminase
MPTFVPGIITQVDWIMIAMWFRLRPDIRYSDLGYGMLRCLFAGGRAQILQELDQRWAGTDHTFACLSVRTGFDLLWEALALPAGSEVVVTALTIPDMVTILKRHQLIPVPLDISPDTLAPNPEALRRCLSPKTRAIVLTHLFGTYVPVEPLLQILAGRQVLLIEDCAQAFTGCQGYTGQLQADVAMFSFGPIKTATALGGSLFRVRDKALLRRLHQIHDRLPRQRCWPFFLRLWKYLLLKLATSPPVWGLIVRICTKLDLSYDKAISQLARGFSGKQDLIKQVRYQPSTPLLALLRRRLANCNAQDLQRRQHNGELLMKLLSPRVEVGGAATRNPSFWLFPVLSRRRAEIISQLRQHGFDGSQHHTLAVVPMSGGLGHGSDNAARRILDTLMFVPAGSAIPEREIRRLAECLLTISSQLEDATDPKESSRSTHHS